MSNELIWAFDEPKKVGSIHRVTDPEIERWGESGLVDNTVPMYILREATREEWEAGGGANYTCIRRLFFYAVSTD